MTRRSPSITIIGSGFGGIGMAIELRRAGFRDITIVEKADDVGGVWRDNTYPGAACDVPSHLYSFSFAPKHDWSRRFAPQAEIHRYLRETAESFGVLPHIRFGMEVTDAAFDETSGTWTVTFADGTRHTTDVLISAVGQLSRPAIPRLPGLDTFGGAVFHSATWDHDYDLTGKRVGVIGTGASAIQFVPEVAPQAAELTLFQRSAPHVLPKPDYPYPDAAITALRLIPGLHRLSRWATYWTLEPRATAFTKYPRLMKLVDWRFRRHLRKHVPDPELRARLTPTDPIGCKRVLLSNNYYPALSRPNVDVVTDPIAEITPTGVRTADGVLHELDAILLGTGFAATDFLAPMHITGLDGVDLNDAWRDGAEAHLGMTVSGFPNMFLLYGPNTNLSHSSIVFMLESQFRYVVQAVNRLAEGDIRSLDVLPEAQSAFNETIQRRVQDTVWAAGCHSWYQTDSGKNTNNWPGFTVGYRQRTRRLDPADFRTQPAETARIDTITTKASAS
ncbi:NAD(P)/FAD-dependent oxidoreductase [Gordonia sinesedis]